MGQIGRESRGQSGASEVENTMGQHINSVLGGPPEPTPEASEPASVGTRVGWVGAMQPRLSPPSETNSETCEEQKDERGKGHPERRRGISGEVRVVQGANLMLDKREQGDIYSERDEGEDGGEERDKGREEGNRSVSEEREEECNE